MRARGITRALAVLPGIVVFATAGGVAAGSIAVTGASAANSTISKTGRPASGGTAITANARSQRKSERRDVRKHRRLRKHARTRRAASVAAVASWYYDYGNTACGFHARYGVANKTLPCGTHVRISYGGRTVDATVDDRGPYVYGRSYDLDQTVSRALGMSGVATVQVAQG
jgi:rare lipoprotein A